LPKVNKLLKTGHLKNSKIRKSPTLMSGMAVLITITCIKLNLLELKVAYGEIKKSCAHEMLWFSGQILAIFNGHNI